MLAKCQSAVEMQRVRKSNMGFTLILYIYRAMFEPEAYDSTNQHGGSSSTGKEKPSKSGLCIRRRPRPMATLTSSSALYTTQSPAKCLVTDKAKHEQHTSSQPIIGMEKETLVGLLAVPSEPISVGAGSYVTRSWLPHCNSSLKSISESAKTRRRNFSQVLSFYGSTETDLQMSCRWPVCKKKKKRKKDFYNFTVCVCVLSSVMHSSRMPLGTYRNPWRTSSVPDERFFDRGCACVCVHM